MIEILNDIPLPKKQSSRMINEWPIEQLDVDQCFMVGCDEMASDRKEVERRLRAAASRYGHRLGRKYACRRVDTKEIGLWRTA